MERRKFVIGVGSLAAGGAAAMGSGAFSAMTADRDANINVVADGDGLLALVPDHESDTIRNDDGELVIDFTADGNAGGVNKNSIYQIGAIDTSDGQNQFEQNFSGDVLLDGSPTDNAAFIIENQDTQTQSVSLDYDPDGPIGDSTAMFVLESDDRTGYLWVGGERRANLNDPVDDRRNEVNLPPGETAGVSIWEEGGDVEDNLSGMLTIESDEGAR